VHNLYSLKMLYYQHLSLALIIGLAMFQYVCGVARVKKSADDNLRDPGTYIIQFEDSATDAQLQHFTKQLNSRSNGSFKAQIIAEYPSIKCLTARLSDRALKWVRANSCSVTTTNKMHSYTNVTMHSYTVKLISTTQTNESIMPSTWSFLGHTS